jgi:hypothetical protein
VPSMPRDGYASFQRRIGRRRRKLNRQRRGGGTEPNSEPIPKATKKWRPLLAAKHSHRPLRNRGHMAMKPDSSFKVNPSDIPTNGKGDRTCRKPGSKSPRWPKCFTVRSVQGGEQPDRP